MTAPRLSALIARAVVDRLSLQEPAIVYEDRTYPESVLRQTVAAGTLPALGDLAAGVPGCLAAFEAARQRDRDPVQVVLCEAPPSGDALPDGAQILLPLGWELVHIRLGYVDPLPGP